MDKTLESLQEVVWDAQKKLNEKQEWLDRFRGYSKGIKKNVKDIEEIRSKFRQWKPFGYYLSTSTAGKAISSIKIDLRYLGQKTAELYMKNGEIYIDTNLKADNNESYFDCHINYGKVLWKSEEAAEFRKHFRNHYELLKLGKPVFKKKNKLTGSDEARIESAWLEDMAGGKSAFKSLKQIQPVKVAGFRYSMPTAITGSNHWDEIEIRDKSFGHIDMFARYRVAGNKVRLLVMELKDQCEKKEKPIDALHQSVLYTVFIRELLRSNCGADWWELFGFPSKLPEKLELYAVSVMPSDDKFIDRSFGGEILDIGDEKHRDEIHLHYIYYTLGDLGINVTETSLRKLECE